MLQFLLLLAIAWFLWQQRKPATHSTSRKIILDTCALIDGRILELSKSGFVPEELVIPEFVLHELQLLADGADAHKRDRARYGLDVVRELQAGKYCTVVIDHSVISDKPTVDDKLVALAKLLSAQLYTTDYNLNKVADIEGIRVLNVNELAQNLRPTALPGEHKDVKIVQKGSNNNQGVGYLEDGTMVVTDGAARLIGKKISVEITRIHQTVAGKMLFAQVNPKDEPLVQSPKVHKAISIRQRLKTRSLT